MASFKVKTATEFRDDFLRSVRNALITQAGISNPNVSFGTDHYIIGEALGKIAELASFNAIAAANAQMADTATGDDLGRIAAIYGLALKPAGGSSGNLVFSSVNSVGLITGLQLIDPSGLRYQVAIAGIYANGDDVPITSIDTGSGTNLPEGTQLTWVSPPGGVNPKALISIGGLTGGVNAETDEDLRTRLLNRLRNPIGGGNWSQFADVAENSSVAVQKAYVYPAYNGPSTVQVSVVRSTTDTNKNKDINSLIVNGTILPAVQAEMFEGINLLVTTVNNVNTDVSIGLSLPNASTASVPGPGGGWLDGVPWPTPLDSSINGANIVTVSTSTSFTVESGTAPIKGISKFVFITDDWKIIHSKVIDFNAIGDTYIITVDTPCTGIAVGDWIFPDAVRIETYITTLLEQFNNLGPGQITDISGLLPYALRRPLTSDSNPSNIGPSILKFISNTGNEVLDVQYLYKNPDVPALPTNVTAGPNLLVPRRIAFYPIDEEI